MKLLFTYIATLLTLSLLDTVWLGLLAKSFYKKHLGHIFRGNFVWPAVILFYLLYAAAIVYLAAVPAGESWIKASTTGVVLGLTVYMTYDLVNFATLKDWPLNVIFIDIAWGGFLTGCAATAGFLISKP